MYVYVKNAFYDWMDHCGRPIKPGTYWAAANGRLLLFVALSPTLLTTSTKHDDIAETGPRINVEYNNHNAKWQVVKKNDTKDFSPVRDWRSTPLEWHSITHDLDLGSGHTAYRGASLIDLYENTKFHWNWKNYLRTDGRTYVLTDGHFPL